MPTRKTQTQKQPLTRQPRVPRNRVTAKTGGLETRFHSRFLSGNVTTQAAAQAYGYSYISPPLNGTTVDPGSVISLSYQEYVVEASKFIYTPAVGTTTSGTVWACFVDNPEIIYRMLSSYSQATVLAICQSTGMRIHSAPVWQAFELTAPQGPRRKMFSSDSTVPTSAEIADRTVQGMWLFATNGAPFSTTIGYVSQEYTARLRGPQLQSLTSI